jgi:hypothetical protein
MLLIKTQTLRPGPMAQDISAILFTKWCLWKMDIGLIRYAGMFTTRHTFVTPNTVVQRYKFNMLKSAVTRRFKAGIVHC